MLKRAVDILLTVFAMPIWLPLLGAVAVLVRVQIGPPVFFKQARGGLNGSVIQLLKFRSMTAERDAGGVLLPDAQRLTKLGLFLRRSSLDELPSLFNVLRGELSLVGPRPLIADYLPLYSREQSRRHELKPGITGWAQVNGRNALSWEEKFKLDIWYVDHQSLWLDIRILWLTVRKVLTHADINAQGEATVPRFTGNRN